MNRLPNVTRSTFAASLFDASMCAYTFMPIVTIVEAKQAQDDYNSDTVYPVRDVLSRAHRLTSVVSIDRF